MVPRRVAIAAGGTGGHITAGLAIAEAYQKAYADVAVCFIGTECGLERRLVPSAGYPLEIVPGTPIAGDGHLADRTYVGFEDARRSIGWGPVRVTGHPLRTEITEVAARKARRRDGWDRPARVVVLGGSMGSRFLNGRTPALLERVRERGVALEVRHQTGKSESGPVARAYRDARIPASVEAFISDIADTYRWADFAITSAGALTLAELAASGIPALLVPLKDSAGNHQVANAKSFAGSTGGWWVSEDAWDRDSLAERLASLLRGVEEWETASKRAREFATPDAARALVADCEDLMSGWW